MACGEQDPHQRPWVCSDQPEAHSWAPRTEQVLLALSLWRQKVVASTRTLGSRWGVLPSGSPQHEEETELERRMRFPGLLGGERQDPAVLRAQCCPRGMAVSGGGAEAGPASREPRCWCLKVSRPPGATPGRPLFIPLGRFLKRHGAGGCVTFKHKRLSQRCLPREQNEAHHADVFSGWENGSEYVYTAEPKQPVDAEVLGGLLKDPSRIKW